MANVTQGAGLRAGSLIAAASTEDKIGFFGKLDTNGKLVIGTANQKENYVIQTEAPANHPVSVVTSGIVLVEADGTPNIAQGDWIKVVAGGKAGKASANNDVVHGRALHALTVNGTLAIELTGTFVLRV